MHSIRVHKVINQIVSFFYLIGFWHRGDKATVRELRIKFFYCFFYSLFVASLAVGAVKNENRDTSIFLAEASIGGAVLAIKLWQSIWKQNQILDLLNRVSVFSLRNDDDFNNFNGELRGLMKFVAAFVIIINVGCSGTMVLPFVGREKTLFLEIAFPLDWKNNEIAFWMASIYISTGVILTLITITFYVIIWYLLFVCSLRYAVLKSELKRMGRIAGKPTVKRTTHQKHFIFFEDLKASIDAHLNLRKLTVELGSYFSNLFFIQFGTSGICICGSIYCLAFNIGDNLVERVLHLLAFLYVTADIFMITYLGNEIKLSSNRLSYSLFESDWYEQPQATKKCLIVFGEYLKQSQELMVGKLYPLTLETFTRILNSAYSMFNILKSFNK